jgi:hypothetical protein
MYFLGIDPGLEGAFALLDAKGTIILHKKMPVFALKNGRKTSHEYDTVALVSFFNTLVNDYPNTTVGIEQQNSSTGQGVVSVCTQCGGYGLLRGMIHYSGLPVIYIKAADWKRDLMTGLPKDKLASVVVVSRLHPAAAKEMFTKNPDHNLADAVLIAEWTRRRAIRLQFSTDLEHI